LLGQTPDANAVPATLNPDRSRITEETFDDLYSKLLEKYNLTVPTRQQGPLQLAQGSSPSSSSGASGSGQLYLIGNEDSELNTHLPTARDLRLTAGIINSVAGSVMPIPSIEAHLAFWGMGLHSNLFSGITVGDVLKVAAEVIQIAASHETDQAGIASRTATYQRRT